MHQFDRPTVARAPLIIAVASTGGRPQSAKPGSDSRPADTPFAMGRMPPDLTIVTFNVLCPVYKRLGSERHRESHRPALWRARLHAVIAELEACTPVPDVICLQEFWFAPEAVALFRARFGDAYTFILTRRPGKDDGLATLIRKRSPAFAAPSGVTVPCVTREFGLLPPGASDRVAQLVSLPLAQPALLGPAPKGAACLPRELLLVHTHLAFPHNKLMNCIRLEQARALTRVAAAFAAKRVASAECAGGLDAVILGDLNGEPECRVGTHLQNAGYNSVLTDLWGSFKPATHYNHLGQSVFFDHVLLRRFFPPRAGGDAAESTCRLPSLGFKRAPKPLLRARDSLRRTWRALPSAEGARLPAAVGSVAEGASTTTPAASVSMDSVTLTFADADPLRSARLDDTVGTSNRPKRSLERRMMLYESSLSMGAIDDSASVLGCSVVPLQARVLPDGLPADTWPKAWATSDHRPICAEFRYSWWVLARNPAGIE